MSKFIYVLSIAEIGNGGTVLAVSTSFESLLGYVAEEYGPNISEALNYAQQSVTKDGEPDNRWYADLNECDYLVIREMKAI